MSKLDCAAHVQEYAALLIVVFPKNPSLKNNCEDRFLLARDDYLMLVARLDDQITGFIIGRLLKAPEVYNPGGLTLMIDDFCISKQSNWESTGGALIRELRQSAKEKDAAQVLVVCGAHDEAKRKFLKDGGLQVVSEWYVGGIDS